MVSKVLLLIQLNEISVYVKKVNVSVRGVSIIH